MRSAVSRMSRLDSDPAHTKFGIFFTVHRPGRRVRAAVGEEWVLVVLSLYGWRVVAGSISTAPTTAANLRNPG